MNIRNIRNIVNNNSFYIIFNIEVVLLLFKNLSSILGIIYYLLIGYSAINILKLKINFFPILKDLWLGISVLIVFGLVQLYEFNFFAFKEFISGISIIVICVQAYYIFNSRKNSKSILLKVIAYSGAFIAFTGFINYIFYVLNWPHFNLDSEFAGSNLNADYNMFALSILLSVVCIINLITKTELKSKNKLLFYQLLLFIVELSIIWTNSRRGIIVLFLLLIYLAIFKFKKVKIFIISNVIVLFFIFFFFLSSASFRSSLTRHSLKIQNKITYFTNRYLQLFNEDLRFLDLRHKLWFDSNIPGVGWAELNSKVSVPDSIKLNINSYAYSLNSNVKYSTNSWLSFYRTRFYINKMNLGDSLYSSCYVYVSSDFNGENVWLNLRSRNKRNSFYDMSKKGKWQKLEVSSIGLGEMIDVYLFISKKGLEGFKNMKGNVYIYYPNTVHNRININVGKKITINNRKERFKYAWDIFLSEFNINNKIFGKGFFYIELFGKKFNRNYGYPHNPLLSSLLYSGILGASLYLVFLILVFIKYIKKIKHLKIYFIMYLISFFFAQVSGNSHFSIVIFNVLSLIPFINFKNKISESIYNNSNI